MITGYEEITHDLTPDELRLIPGMVRGLETKIGKANAITSSQIIKVYRERGEKMTGARVRKMINHIRMTGLVERLVATSTGYYVSNDPKELQDYIRSLYERADSIVAVAKQIEYQTKKLSHG